MGFQECLEAQTVCTGRGSNAEMHRKSNTHHWYPRVMLEVVASYDMQISHVHFGIAGLNKDLKDLNSSSLFNDIQNDTTHVATFKANDVEYQKSNYVADEIYPSLATYFC